MIAEDSYLIQMIIYSILIFITYFLGYIMGKKSK